MKLDKEQYHSGDKFENPYTVGNPEFQLHIYPDPKYDNNWLAVISGAGDDINDNDKIIINKQIMKRRIAYQSKSSQPFITRAEAIKLLTSVFSRFDSSGGMISFTQ